MNTQLRQRHVVIVGGGLAGLAAAAALVDSGLRVTVLEARRRAGGRAASFEDPVAGGLVDACQHVAMGCCTNFLDLCRQAGLTDALRHDRTLWFIGPDGERAACTPSRLLPAPLHLAPLLFGMRHFSLGEKISLGLGMLRLARFRGADATDTQTAQAWLAAIGQPERVIRLFWQPVLESALGESIDLVSVSAARKVAVDGFLAHREAADLHVPTVPLGSLFGDRFVGWLESQGVAVQTGRIVTGIERDAAGLACAVACGDAALACDAVVVALPWKQAARLLPDLVPVADERLAGSPITAVHLWFDRDVIDLPHAVLVGRVSQWVFRADVAAGGSAGYCQVVISASRGLLDGDRDRLLETVVAELREIFPAARTARLVDSRIVTDPTAVLSVRPGVDAARPPAISAVDNLFLAGDWTATGWPSTMEGAVRSGRIAAAAVLAQAGRPRQSLTADLPKGPLVRLLTGG
jgi:squalene-associated FAD-dependent desaturase